MGSRSKKKGSHGRSKGSPVSQYLTVATSVATSASLERPEHNSRIDYIIEPHFPRSDPRANLVSPEGSPGVYKATFALSVPGKDAFRTSVAPALRTEGDSLLALPSDATVIEIVVRSEHGDHGEVQLVANSQRHLSHAILQVQAASFAEAERKAYDMVSAILSYLSYANDIAIDVAGYDLVEEAVGTTKILGGVVGKVKTLSSLGESTKLVSDPDYKRLFTSYREGLNATNEFYQALSLYKVIEGCAAIRARKRKQARDAGIVPSEPTLEVPHDIAAIPIANEFSQGAFAAFLGWKFHALRDHFRAVVRNAIAHLDPDKVSLEVDRLNDVFECRKAIPVLMYVARQWITMEIQNP